MVAHVRRKFFDVDATLGLPVGASIAIQPGSGGGKVKLVA